jgi:hypothetical protein
LDPGRQLGSGRCFSQLLRTAYIARKANAQDCPSSIKKVLDRFRATMKNVEGNIWDCTDNNVQTFVEKTVAKANLLVNQAEDACRIGSVYHQLLPLLQ